MNGWGWNLELCSKGLRWLYKRGKIWWMNFTFAGKPYRESTKCTDKKLAFKVAQKRLDDLIKGKHNIKSPEKIKFYQLAKKYKVHSKKKKKSYRTDEYRLDIAKEFFGDESLILITLDELEEFYDKLIADGRGESTINRYNALFKNMFNLSKRWFGVPEENPARYFEKYGEVSRERYLSKDELNLLLSMADGHIKNLIILAMYTAGRLKELLNMKWGRVDFEKKTITFWQYKTSQWITLPLLPPLESYLKQMKRECEYIIHFEGKPIQSPKKAFYKLVEKCKIKDFIFHDLRHTSATYLFLSGVSAEIIQKILGHKNIKTTMRYIHIPSEHLIQEMKKFSLPKMLFFSQTVFKMKNCIDIEYIHTIIFICQPKLLK